MLLLMVQKAGENFWLLALIVFEMFMFNHHFTPKDGSTSNYKKKKKKSQHLLYMFKLWTVKCLCKSSRRN